jgi:tetratricopeptide (TPR) repeat protein
VPDGAATATASPGGERWLLWHWGDNGDMQAFVAGDPAAGRALVVLTNSANGMSIMPDLVQAVFGGAFGVEHPAWAWPGYERFDAPQRVLARAVLARGPDALRAWRAAHPGAATTGSERVGLSEARLVQLGEALVGKERARDAAGVLEAAVEAYPRSVSAQAALGDAYRRLGERERAVRSYHAALALDSTSERVARALRRLERPVVVASEHLAAYVGRYQAPFGVIAVSREGDQLLVRVAGEPTTELVALTERRFLVGDDGGPEITFVSDPAGRVTHALLHLRDQEFRAPRLE